MIAKVLFIGAGLGLGGDFSATQSDVKFRDPLNFPDPRVFEGSLGKSFVSSAGLSWPRTAAQNLGVALGGGSPTDPDGYGASAIRLGQAGSVGKGPIFGWQISIGAMVGSSTVIESRTEPCSCN